MQTTMKSAKRILAMLLVFALVVGTAFTGMGSFLHIADEAYATGASVTANVTLVGSENWTGWHGEKHPVIAQELEIDKFNIEPFITDSAGSFSEPDGIKTAHALIEAVYYSIYGVDADATALSVAADSDTAMAVKEKLYISWDGTSLSQNSVYGNPLYNASYVNNSGARHGIGEEPVTGGSNIAFAEYGAGWAPTYNYFDVLEVEPEIQTSSWGTSTIIKLELRQNLAGWANPTPVEGSIIRKFVATNHENYPFGENPWPYGTTNENGIASVEFMDSDAIGMHSFLVGGCKEGNKLAYLRCSYNYDGTTISAIKLSEGLHNVKNTSLSKFTINNNDVRAFQANGFDYTLVSAADTVTVNVELAASDAVIDESKIYVDAQENTFSNPTGGSIDLTLANGSNTLKFTVVNGSDREKYTLNVIKSATTVDNASTVTSVINAIGNSDYAASSSITNWIIAKSAAGKTISNDEKTKFIKRALLNAKDPKQSPGSAAKDAIAFSSIGIDPTKVKNIVAEGEIDLVNKAFTNPEKIDIYSLPYVLMLMDLGYDSNNPNCTREKLIQRAINTYSGSTGWGKDNSWGIDSSAMMLPALAKYYNAAGVGVDGVSAALCTQVKTIVDAEIANYSTIQDPTTGVIFGNSNSTAVVISALSAYGINVNTDQRFKKGIYSLIDSLLLYKSTENKLGYADKTTDEYASLQGMEALINYQDAVNAGDGNDYLFTKNVTQYTNWPEVKLLTDLLVTAPSKTTYIKGENFSTDGMVVKAVYNGILSAAETLTSGQYNISLANGTELDTAGVTTVAIAFTFDNDTQEREFNVVVNESATVTVPVAKVSVTVESDTGVIASNNALIINPGETTAMDALKTVLNEAGKTCVIEKNGSYVASIDGLAELDKGPYSGWMYMVNGITPQTTSADDYVLRNGQSLTWYYTLDYTTDPRNKGENGVNMGAGSKETTTEKTATASVETTANVTDGKATANVSVSDVTKAIEQVAEQAKADTTGKTTEKEVVLEVKSTGNVDAVETTIPANAVSELAKADANVVVKTECGNIEIPADSMDNIATQAAGQELSINMENKKAADVVATVGADKIKEETGLDTKELENVSIVEVTITAGDKAITSFGGKKISLSLPADNGQVAGKSYKVLAISADGSMELMTGVCVVENGKKVVKVTSSHLTTFVVTGEEVKNPFTDVSANDYFFNPVLWAVENKITSGKTADTFAPFEDCTRAQMVTFLWRAAGSPWASANTHFSDVPEGAYYAEAVEWAIAAGITKGIGETTFAPNDVVTREQLASFIYRYAQSKGQGFTGAWMFLLDYSDASSVSEWADEAMHWCVMNNIVTGMSANMLAPQNPANRAQIVTMLYRYFNL